MGIGEHVLRNYLSNIYHRIGNQQSSRARSLVRVPQEPRPSLWVVASEVTDWLVLTSFTVEIYEIHHPAAVRQHMQE